MKEKLYTQRLKKGNLLIIRLMKFTERKTEEGKSTDYPFDEVYRKKD